MRLGESLLERVSEASADQLGEVINTGGSTLRDSVALAVADYLKQLDGQMASDVYQMVLAEVEAPLLEAIMEYTKHNQTKASRMLGLNRGTLRKKLKIYGLLRDNGA